MCKIQNLEFFFQSDYIKLKNLLVLLSGLETIGAFSGAKFF